MTRARVLIFAVAALTAPAVVHAQAITQVVHTVYPQGSNTPAQAAAVLIFPSGWSCGQKPKIPRPTTTVVNPTRLVLDDPNDATADCIFQDSLTANGGLFSLPFGIAVYESTMKFVNASNISSPESARSNLFSHPGSAPPAPTGSRIVRLFIFGSRALGFRRTSAGRTNDGIMKLVGAK